MTRKSSRQLHQRALGMLALLLPLAAASCAGLDANDQGVLQPQTTVGPCQVKKFYILNVTSVRTEMTVSNAGQGCSFTIFNPDLQIVTDAALVTTPASHGRAEAGLLFAGRQASVTYTPQPGYTGPDRFAITLEPSDRGVTVNVIVQGLGPT